MPRSTYVQFRGESHEVTIEYESGFDPETGSNEIVWFFTELTPDQHDALNITDEEEESIFGQLASLEPPSFDDDYF